MTKKREEAAESASTEAEQAAPSVAGSARDAAAESEPAAEAAPAPELEAETEAEPDPAAVSEPEQTAEPAPESDGEAEGSSAVSDAEGDAATELASGLASLVEGESPLDSAAIEPAAEDRADGDVRFCEGCGASIEPGQAFCASCGRAIASSTAPAASPASSSEEPKQKLKVNPKILVPVVVAVIAVVLAAIFIVPEVLATPDDLFEKGRYEDAYNRSEDGDKDAMIDRIIGAGESELAYGLVPDDKKDATLVKIVAAGDFEAAYSLAPEDRKRDILIANLVAVKSAEVAEGLKDPDSFCLVDGVFDSGENRLVLEVSGANSYGGRVSNFYVYSYSEKSGEYIKDGYVADLEDEKIYRYADTYTEKLEKATNNLTRSKIREAITNGDFLDDPLVGAINDLFKNAGGLDGVSLVSAIGELYPGGGDTV